MFSTARRHALVDWLSATAGVPFVWVSQNATPPPPPYGTIKLGLGNRAQGVSATADEKQLTSTPGEQRIVKHRQHVVTLQAFTQDTVVGTAESVLLKVLDSLSKQATRDALDAAKLAVQDAGAIQDLSGGQGARSESRAVVELTFSTADTDTEQVGWIDTFEGGATVAPRPEDGITVG